MSITNGLRYSQKHRRSQNDKNDLTTIVQVCDVLYFVHEKPRIQDIDSLTQFQEESEEESDSNVEAAGSSTRNRLDFCTNPEELRARREASYLARRGKGHRPAVQAQPRYGLEF